MKRKIFSILLVLVLALSLGLLPAVPALAWDEEDPCVASNEDFFVGMGFDTDTELGEGHVGGQGMIPPGDGYNLYRDDVSDSGNLDIVVIRTETPENIDLPLTQPINPPHNPLATMGDESPDAYYWATEPRGYNLPPTKADILEDSDVPGKGLDTAPGLQKPFNPDSKAGDHAGKK